MKNQLLLAILFVIAVMAVAVIKTPSRLPDYRTVSAGGDGPTQRGGPTPPRRPVFRDATVSSQLFATHLQASDHLSGLNETLGSGACAFDYDNDGWTDLFFLGGSGERRHYGRSQWWQSGSRNQLFRNLGDGRFQEISTAAGLEVAMWGMGCAAADLDNDGDQDLLVTGLRDNRLFRNDGDGHFTDITRAAGIPADRWTTSAAIGDYDQDGLLDIYLVNYIDYTTGKRTFEPTSGFAADDPPGFNPQLFDSQPNQLLHNRGNLQFEDHTEATGVADASGRGLAALWVDLNGDHYPELLVANDGGLPNPVYVNQRDGTFQTASEQTDMGSALPTRGLAAGDIDQDGQLEFILSTASDQPPILYHAQPGTTGGDQQRVPRYRDVARELGLDNPKGMGSQGWGAAVADFNNDGQLDIFIANGFAIPDHDSPKIALGQPNSLWLNQGGKGFTPCGSECFSDGIDSLPSRTVVVADFDNDGAPDLLLTQNNGPAQLLKNLTTGQHWLGVELIAHNGNRDAIGATVVVRTAQQLQHRTLIPGGFLGSSDKRLHFGLGADDRVLSLQVTWPDGTLQALGEVPIDCQVRLIQGDPAVVPLCHPALPAVAAGNSAAPTPFAQVQHRLEVVNWLLAAGRREDALAHMQTLLQSSDAQTRQQAVTAAGQWPGPELTAALYAALADAQPGVRAAALTTLGSLEDEFSARWLLRGFGDPDPAVRCAVADLYRFFFREEEAMVNSKGLAVPRLLRQLADPDQGVKRCAIEALGESEDYRAMPPLLALLTERIDEPVAVEAVRTLGLIRERQALAPVIAIFLDPHQAPRIRQQALIACKRLGHPDVPRLIGDALAMTAPAQSAPLLDLLRELPALPRDGTVVAPQDIGQAVADWFATVSEDGRRRPPDEVVERFMRVIEATAHAPALPAARDLLGDQDAAVRASAYRVVIALTPTADRCSLIETALTDPAAVVRDAAYSAAAHARITVAASAVPDETPGSAARAQAITLLAQSAEPAATARLLQIAQDNRGTPHERALALKLLDEHHHPLTELDPQRLRDDPEVWTAYAIVDLHRQLAAPLLEPPPAAVLEIVREPAEPLHQALLEALLERPENWARRLLVDACLDQATPRSLRQAIITSFATRPTHSSTAALLTIIARTQDDLAVTAIAALPDNPDTRAKLRDLAQQEGLNESLRFAAARTLHQRAPEAALQAVMH